MPFHQGALADLVNVRAVGLHAIQIPHDVDVAHAVLRLARGGKEDVAVGEVKRVDVKDSLGGGKRLEAGAVSVDFVKVIVVADVLPHGEHDALAIEVNVGITNQPLRAGVGHDTRLPIPAKVDGLERPAGLVAAGVAFSRLEHGLGVVVVRTVLTAHHIEQRLAADERVGSQRFAAKLLKILLRKPSASSHLVEPCEEGLAAGIPAAEGSRQIRDGIPQSHHFVGAGVGEGVSPGGRHLGGECQDKADAEGISQKRGW